MSVALRNFHQEEVTSPAQPQCLTLVKMVRYRIQYNTALVTLKWDTFQVTVSVNFQPLRVCPCPGIGTLLTVARTWRAFEAWCSLLPIITLDKGGCTQFCLVANISSAVPIWPSLRLVATLKYPLAYIQVWCLEEHWNMPAGSRASWHGSDLIRNLLPRPGLVLITNFCFCFCSVFCFRIRGGYETLLPTDRTWETGPAPVTWPVRAMSVVWRFWATWCLDQISVVRYECSQTESRLSRRPF